MEYWDLYDRNRNALDKLHLRGEKLNDGEYHIVVSIWTINSNGEILLTLRDSNKEAHPNKWEVTAGSVLTNESSLNAAARELKEETGISVSTEELKLIGTFEGKNALHDIYLLIKDIDISHLTFQVGETVDAKWVSKAEFLELMNSGELARPIGRRYNFIKDELSKYIK